MQIKSARLEIEHERKDAKIFFWARAHIRFESIRKGAAGAYIKDEKTMGRKGFEPSTFRLSVERSTKLS